MICRCYCIPWYSQRWIYLIIESPRPSALPVRESSAWPQPHDSPGPSFTMICPASPYCPTFCDFSPFHYLFLSLLTFPACPYPIRSYVLRESSHAKLLHKVLFTSQKRMQSNGQRDVLDVPGDLLSSFWNTLR